VLDDRSSQLARLRSCFEVDYPPPERFLRWLIEHPGSLTWPLESKKTPRKFGGKTEASRHALIAGDTATHDLAVLALEKSGTSGSRGKWWAFEGFTSVDCVLETDSLLVFIEGKRTEPISAATDWYPQRNQIVRNVEVASCAAAEARKNFGVILCAEEPVPVLEQDFIEGLPHLSQPDRDALRTHYWGCITWNQIVSALCPGLRLRVISKRQSGYVSD